MHEFASGTFNTPWGMSFALGYAFLGTLPNVVLFIMSMTKHVSIIGSGFSSLSAACYMAKAGYEVDVYEKNATPGGRARHFSAEGYTFDMGPTWYWMPDIFERFFGDFGKRPSDYYDLVRLDPGYRVYFDRGEPFDVSATLDDLEQKFEAIEKGAGEKLAKFLKLAKGNYDAAMTDVVYKPGRHPFELITPDTAFQLKQFFLTIRSYVHKHFKDDRLRQLLEFPVLFLGAKPDDTPLFYSFMNHADLNLGTWYPKGGMSMVVKGMVALAEELGVKFHYNSAVEKINVDSNSAMSGLSINGESVKTSLVISGADYAHSESLLEEKHRGYSDRYWDTRLLAPSALLFFVGFDKTVEGVEHHTLFFDSPFDGHAKQIYDTPEWPDKPLFYASFASKTDPTTAPAGCEAATFLIPLAPDLEDTENIRERYFVEILTRLEAITNQRLGNSVVYKRSYCLNDFKDDYHSYKGNAYGLANTLMQTAFLRPKIKSKRVRNLYFTGQLTVPGPGVPPSLISGKIVSDSIINDLGA